MVLDIVSNILNMVVNIARTFFSYIKSFILSILPGVPQDLVLLGIAFALSFLWRMTPVIKKLTLINTILIFLLLKLI